MTRDQFGRINPGDIYEDCAFHPVLCTAQDEVSGISLTDATAPCACSRIHCGVIKLTVTDVLAARDDFPPTKRGVSARSPPRSQALDKAIVTGAPASCQE